MPGSAILDVSSRGALPHPFGIQNINGIIYDLCLTERGSAHDDVPGEGHGYVNAFDTAGNFLVRVASRGELNSPWGLAIAPLNFGKFSGDLLVGNFGDGRIHAFDPGHIALGNFRCTRAAPPLRHTASFDRNRRSVGPGVLATASAPVRRTRCFSPPVRATRRAARTSHARGGGNLPPRRR